MSREMADALSASAVHLLDRLHPTMTLCGEPVERRVATDIVTMYRARQDGSMLPTCDLCGNAVEAALRVMGPSRLAKAKEGEAV